MPFISDSVDDAASEIVSKLDSLETAIQTAETSLDAVEDLLEAIQTILSAQSSALTAIRAKTDQFAFSNGRLLVNDGLL